LRARQIEQALNLIKLKMTDTPGIENMRTLISTHLTKILMLYGRLHTDYNARYLPVTVNSILVLINELEMIEKKFYSFDEILKENIERREKYSNVFLIPGQLATDPSTKGLRIAMCILASPIIQSYCEEDRRFLETLDGQISLKTKQTLFARTIRNCEMLRNCASAGDAEALETLKEYCRRRLAETETGNQKS
jgi:hypothetical protein